MLTILKFSLSNSNLLSMTSDKSVHGYVIDRKNVKKDSMQPNRNKWRWITNLSTLEENSMTSWQNQIILHYCDLIDDLKGKRRYCSNSRHCPPANILSINIKLKHGEIWTVPNCGPQPYAKEMILSCEAWILLGVVSLCDTNI